MRFGVNLCSVLVLLWASVAAVAQEKPQDDGVRTLIEQLGDDAFAKREAAEERLIEIGSAAIERLRAATKSDNAEIAFRSKRAIDRITTLLPAEQEELRKQAQAAFYAGDFEQMARRYRRLLQAHNATIDDGRWLGHAYQLGSQWKEAAGAYAAVIERMDRLLDRGAKESGPVGGPGANQWPASAERALVERSAAILLTARIERYLLKDPIAAEKTLRRIHRYNPVFGESLDTIEKDWKERLAAVIEEGKELTAVKRDHRRSQELRFPLLALRELAAVQQLNGHQAEALDTWRRIHLTTCHYVGFTEGIDSAAVERLIQDLPAAPEEPVPGVTFLDPDRPAAEFDLHEAATFLKSYDIRQNYSSFALSAKKNLEFESLEFACDIEQVELRYGGQFDCWTLVGEQGRNRKGIGYMHWPNGKEVGRDIITQKFAIEPGTGLVHFTAGSWKDKFKVHSIKVTATFRPRVKDGAKAERPIPGFTFHTEFLPPGGSISINGKPYGNETTTHNVVPGRSSFEYAHPRMKEPRQFTLDLKPGANYSVFVNLDSPLSGELTNLRGFHLHYGPSNNIVKMKDGRWLTAWCNGGLQFASSENLLTWTEPSTTGDSALFNENYNCLAPTLYVDREGTVWVAYFSNQLDIDQVNTGGYRLFLRKSKDGREWSAARPIKMALSGWPPGQVQLFDGPENKTWMLFRLQYAAADSPAELGEFKDLEIPASNVQRSHARNPHATLDADGHMHLVWDHFAQSLHYARRDVDGKWCEPIEIPAEGKNRQSSHPQLIVRNEQLALIYNVSQSTYLRRGTLHDGVPKLGDPLKLASHTAPLISASPLMTTEDRLVFLCGADTVWRHMGSIKDLLNQSPD